MCIDLLVAFAAVMPAGMLKCSRLTHCATAIDMPATAATSLSFHNPTSHATCRSVIVQCGSCSNGQEYTEE